LTATTANRHAKTTEPKDYNISIFKIYKLDEEKASNKVVLIDEEKAW